METWMLYGVVIYMLGVLVARFLSAEVGEVTRIIGAVIVIVMFFARFIH